MTTVARTSLTRRNFVAGSGAAALLAAGADSALPADAQIRPDINSPAGQKMTALYLRAVEAMQEPAINYPPQPQSWSFQSYVHAIPDNPFDPANAQHMTDDKAITERVNQIYGTPAAGSPQAAWRAAALQCWARCEHSTPYFTVWHRWYIYYFERVCRRMCGDASFMLPYWNYASDDGPSLQLPAAFRNPPRDSSGNTPQPSRLVFSNRGSGPSAPDGSGPSISMNDGGYMLLSDISYAEAFQTRSMFPADSDVAYQSMGFMGRLENVPHDTVHGAVGGWMASPAAAASDPIFYLHHCQIDRLTASWETQSGTAYNWGIGGASPTQATWMAAESPFADETGSFADKQLAQAASIQPFGYRYDTLVSPQRIALATRGMPAIPKAPVQLATLRSGSFSIGTRSGTTTLTPAAGAGASTIRRGAPAILTLEDVKLVRRPPSPPRVFINLPSSTPPDPTGPYYVGTLNLFKLTPGGMTMSQRGAGRDMTMPPTDARFDVTDVLLNQRANRLWNGDTVTVTVTTGGAPAGDETYVTVTRATLTP
jgi:tyrosinase